MLTISPSTSIASTTRSSSPRSKHPCITWPTAADYQSTQSTQRRWCEGKG